MATNVVVIDSTARRAVVKTTPQTFLSDVLSEACSKLGANPSQYGLKHNNKQVDLSRTIRLSGLSSGAKLELVQLSKSAGVVSVALQLPPSEAQSAPNGRLTDKFPSTTTLWLLLRKFEAGVAGTPAKRNLTARGAPATIADNSGAGRLYYEQPVLNIMGRELTTFTDLQKSLAQLGFNSGSALVKLTYKTSETPLEEAMVQIQQYFDEVEPQPKKEGGQGEAESSKTAGVQPQEQTQTQPARVQPEWLDDNQMEDVQPTTPAVTSADPTADQTPQTQPLDPQPSTSTEPQVTVSDRPVSVYRPPTASGPPKMAHHDSDYIPTVEHAQIHQKLLQQQTQNRRLPTDAEIEAQQKEQQEKLSQIREVEIKIRFPDQSAVSSKFTPNDTAAGLYDFVRECLDPGLRNETFMLRNPGVRGKGEIIEDSEKQRLILDLGLKGRVLVVFGWHENKASASARGTKNVLREDLKNQAREYVAPEVPSLTAGDDGDKGMKVDLGKKPDSGGGEGSSKSKVPKWLKGLGKK